MAETINVVVKGALLASDTTSVSKGVEYEVISDTNIVVSQSSSPKTIEIITDGSYKYNLPPLCQYRSECADDMVVTLANYGGYPVGSLASHTILAKWSNDPSEYMKSVTALVDITASTVLEHGSDWWIEFAQGQGEFDRIVVPAITNGHKLIFIYGVWPDDGVRGNGGNRVSFVIPPYYNGNSIWITSVDGEAGPLKIDVTEFVRNDAKISPSSYFSEHMVARWPNFVKFLSEYFEVRSHTFSGGYDLLRGFVHDVDTAETSVLDALAAQYINGCPASRLLCKNSRQIWSTKGSVNHAKFAAALYGAKVVEYGRPQDRLARSSGEEFSPKYQVLLVQLDQLDINGLSQHVIRLPSDPQPFTAAQPDILQDLDGKTVKGLVSKSSMVLSFVGWEYAGQVRVARFDVLGGHGKPEPFERVITGVDGIYAHVVPVVSGIRIVNGGNGYACGDTLKLLECASDSLITITQVDQDGRVLMAEQVIEAILVHGKAVGQINTRFGGGAVVEPIIVGHVATRPTGNNWVILRSGDEWHEAAYKLTVTANGSSWVERYKKIAHPAGAQLVVEHNVAKHVVTTSLYQGVLGGGWHRLDDAYWPSDPLVISAGAIVPDPVVLRSYDTGKEQVLIDDSWAVIRRNRARGAWKVASGCEFPAVNPILASDGMGHDRGTFTVIGAGQLSSGAGGQLFVGNKKIHSANPLDFYKWTTNKGTVIDRATHPRIDYDGVSINGGLSTPVVIDDTDDKEVIVLHNGDIVFGIDATVGQQRRMVEFGAHDGVVQEVNTEGNGIITVASTTSALVEDSRSLYVTKVRFSLTSIPDTMVLGVKKASAVFFAAVGDVTPGMLAVSGPTLVKRFSLEPNEEFATHIVLGHVENGATLISCAHPTYMLEIKYESSSVGVVINGSTELTYSLADPTGTRMWFSIARDQTMALVVDSETVWSTHAYHTPETVEYIGSYGALTLQGAAMKTNGVVNNIARMV